MKPSITVVVPALNEENSLEPVLQDLLEAMNQRFDSYELFIFNDGSTDKTGIIADRLAASNSNIQVFHNPQNKGVGYNIFHGFQLSTKDYVMWYPGDSGMTVGSLEEMFKSIGKADMIVSYLANPGFRSFHRQVLSTVYGTILNVLFGLKVRYYNNLVIYRSELIKPIKTSTFGFGFLAEALIRSINEGYTYIEVPTRHRLRGHETSKAFRLQNIIEILKTTIKLRIQMWSNHKKRTIPSSLKGRATFPLKVL